MSLLPAGIKLKVAEEDKKAECHSALHYRSNPLGGVVSRESADVHHSHHVQQVRLVRMTQRHGKSLSQDDDSLDCRV